MIKVAYKPQLNLLDYSFELDGRGITIHSHAAISLDLIKSLALKFEIPYEDDTTFELAETIDKINEAFAVIRDLDRVHELYKSEDVAEMYDNFTLYEPSATVKRCVESSPVVYLAWSRFQQPHQIKRPNKHKGYRLSFVHGHNDEETVGNVVGLNSAVGQFGRHKATDYVLSNQESAELSSVVKLYFKQLKGLKSIQVLPALKTHFDRVIASVKACHSKGDDPELLTRVLNCVRLASGANNSELEQELQQLIQDLPRDVYSKKRKIVMASLLALSVLVTLLAVATLAMSLACPIIAPVLLSSVIGVSSASLGVGSIGVGGFSFSVHKSKQPVENPVSKSLGFFSKQLKKGSAQPKVPSAAAGATEGSSLLQALISA